MYDITNIIENLSVICLYLPIIYLHTDTHYNFNVFIGFYISLENIKQYYIKFNYIKKS